MNLNECKSSKQISANAWYENTNCAQTHTYSYLVFTSDVKINVFVLLTLRLLLHTSVNVLSNTQTILRSYIQMYVCIYLSVPIQTPSSMMKFSG